MATKYRIVRRSFEDGSQSYMPQKRCFFIWVDIYRPGVKMTLDQAESAIESEKSSNESSRITIIKQCPNRESQMNKFQNEVDAWMDACFGKMISGDKEERNWRFLEESIELVQACGGNAEDAHKLVDYVFNRQVGAPYKEGGDALVTLCALLSAHGYRLQDCGDAVLQKNWDNIETIRRKQATKPLNNSPLPQ